MTDTDEGWVPKTLNDPPAFLWWDMTVAIPAIAAIIIGLFAGFLLYAIPLVAGYLWLLRKYKEKLPKGFIFNLAYAIGYLNLKGYGLYAQRTYWE
jgi:type IV conjugative transfer system protein TraL